MARWLADAPCWHLREPGAVITWCHVRVKHERIIECVRHGEPLERVVATMKADGRRLCSSCAGAWSTGVRVENGFPWPVAMRCPCGSGRFVAAADQCEAEHGLCVCGEGPPRLWGRHVEHERAGAGGPKVSIEPKEKRDERIVDMVVSRLAVFFRPYRRAMTYAEHTSPLAQIELAAELVEQMHAQFFDGWPELEEAEDKIGPRPSGINFLCVHVVFDALRSEGLRLEWDGTMLVEDQSIEEPLLNFRPEQSPRPELVAHVLEDFADAVCHGIYHRCIAAGERKDYAAKEIQETRRAAIERRLLSSLANEHVIVVPDETQSIARARSLLEDAMIACGDEPSCGVVEDDAAPPAMPPINGTGNA